MRFIAKKTLNRIAAGGNHYVVKVKDNQKKLKNAIEYTILSSKPIDVYKTTEQNRGRFESRTTYVYERQDNLAVGWESVSLLVYIRRETIYKGKKHQSDSFYVSNLRNKDAYYISECIRFHWHIENKLHYTKDVIMREDASSTKNINAAANLALFRNIVFNILKQTDKSIKYATEIFSNYTVRKILNILMKL